MSLFAAITVGVAVTLVLECESLRRRCRGTCALRCEDDRAVGAAARSSDLASEQTAQAALQLVGRRRAGSASTLRDDARRVRA